MVDLKTIIKMNAIQDNPVAESNAKLMEHLFRPDITTIKGGMLTGSRVDTSGPIIFLVLHG